MTQINMSVKNLILHASVLVIARIPVLHRGANLKARLVEAYLCTNCQRNPESGFRHHRRMDRRPSRRNCRHTRRKRWRQGTQWSLNTREQQNRKLEGRWCLRSTAEIALDGGALHGDIKVRRIALFYPPLVEESAGEPFKASSRRIWFRSSRTWVQAGKDTQ